VAIRTWTATAVGGRGDAPFYFIDYAGAPSTHPLLYNEVDIETPKEHPLYVDVIHGAPDKKEEHDQGGTHIVRLVWTNPKMVAEEPLSPAMSEIVPVILGSTFKSWDDFRSWYTEAVKGFTEPDDEVRRLAAELTKGKNSREDKVRAIFNFVSDDIRYVNYVSGEWWLPNRPQQLLARREGDCDDKAMLLITLLKSIGITAEEVMVQTRETAEPSILKAKNVAAPMFDHGIAFLPGVVLAGAAGATSAGTYLDATSPESRLGPLPSMDARAVALKMNRGPAEIVDMPASSPSDH
ncbi:MAG: transglutaminase-like domain-containing protein, partial [Polyangiaceae bacterium]